MESTIVQSGGSSSLCFTRRSTRSITRYADSAGHPPALIHDTNKHRHTRRRQQRWWPAVGITAEMGYDVIGGSHPAAASDFLGRTDHALAPSSRDLPCSASTASARRSWLVGTRRWKKPCALFSESRDHRRRRPPRRYAWCCGARIKNTGARFLVIRWRRAHLASGASAHWAERIGGLTNRAQIYGCWGWLP